MCEHRTLSSPSHLLIEKTEKNLVPGRYACNMVNHIPAPASSYLRDKLSSWGFTGYRTTDGDGMIPLIPSPSLIPWDLFS